MPNQLKPSETQQVFSQELRKNRGWVFALGIIFVILGFVGLGMTVFLTLVTVLYFGILILIAGVVQLVNTFRSRESANIAFHLLVAVLYGLAGIIIIQHPKLVSAFFTAIIAFILIFQGALKIFWGFRLKDSINSWFWPFLSGASVYHFSPVNKSNPEKMRVDLFKIRVILRLGKRSRLQCSVRPYRRLTCIYFSPSSRG